MKRKVRARPKGRTADPQALEDVRGLLGDAPRRRDLLIEHLHRINDRYGYLSAAHLAALAQEMRLAQAEVYEVASFYHHFEVVKEGEVAPSQLAVRVCDGLACEMAGAQDLLRKLPAIVGENVRVIAAPCIGRCEQAPAVAVHQNPVPNATVDKVATAVAAKALQHVPEGFIGIRGYQQGGGYALLKECATG